MKRSHGAYSKKGRNFRSKGRVAITRHLQTFKAGEKVRIDADPAVPGGRLSSLKFNKRVAEIVGKQGSAYKVRLNDGGKEKFLCLANVHLKRLEEVA